MISPVTANVDSIWESANLLVKLHGKDAPRAAAIQAHSLLENGDTARRLMWLRTMAAAKAVRARGEQS